MYFDLPIHADASELTWQGIFEHLKEYENYDKDKYWGPPRAKSLEFMRLMRFNFRVLGHVRFISLLMIFISRCQFM